MKYRAEYSEVCGYWVILNEEKNFAEGGFTKGGAIDKANELNARDGIDNLEAVKDLDVKVGHWYCTTCKKRKEPISASATYGETCEDCGTTLIYVYNWMKKHEKVKT